MTPEQSQILDQAIGNLKAYMPVALAKLMENNTYTQKNAGKYGVLAINHLVKKLDKAKNAEGSKKTVEELQDAVKKAEEKLQAAKDSLAEAQGEGDISKFQPIIDIANAIPAEYSEDFTGKIKSIAAETGLKGQ